MASSPTQRGSAHAFSRALVATHKTRKTQGQHTHTHRSRLHTQDALILACTRHPSGLTAPHPLPGNWRLLKPPPAQPITGSTEHAAIRMPRQRGSEAESHS